ncbi:hypothetical protein [Puniceicoccus vermicola]|uniref:Glycosyltransferase family 1 protein n=1 Tax=Puniceicoccus vermicola TaxID=388746 RepID=A0A7X1AW47_9BACT|nr:hypothetical protein [Puniceicoccus vermicola]MBC2601088.1 hypothetical protein [Puniceicoccus vermicola]
MSLTIYDPRHLAESGFFQFLFRALKKEGANVVDEVPFPSQSRTDRHHEGAWARIDGALVFFDMSDHVFDFDLSALQRADLYLKANLNRSIAKKVFVSEGIEDVGAKLRPFTFLPPSLRRCQKIGAMRLRKWLRGPTLFHVVGVYENPPARGEADPFLSPGTRIEPHVMHFWVRWHFAQAVRESQLSGISRLTSRGNRTIEDGIHVKANLNHQLYLLRMASSGCTVLNTFPHVVYPWKVLESIALGRPFIVEREPLVEIPEAFRPVVDTHFLEVLPGFGSFDASASLGEPKSYRILEVPSSQAIREGFERVTAVLRDRERMETMADACREFSRDRLNPEFIVSWLRKEVARL